MSFSVPIAPLGAYPGGHFQCTLAPGSTTKETYVLSFTSPADNRVTLPFLSALSLSLKILEHSTRGRGAVIITSGIPKFFSNGFDLEHANENPGFFARCNDVLRELLIFSLPTLALINGHTFGAGVFLALSCDYRIQNPSRGYICLPEIDLGVPIPSTVASLVKAKFPTPSIYRDAVLEGKRFTGKEALEAGIVDGLGGIEEAVKFLEGRKLRGRGNGVVGMLKEDAYREVLREMSRESENVQWRAQMDRERDDRLRKDAEEVEAWMKKQGGAKL